MIVTNVVIAVLSSAIIAYMLSLSEFLATRQTSALTLCVVGVTKQLLLIALAMSIFGDKLGLANVFGFVVALSGVSLYNYARRTGTIGGSVSPTIAGRAPQDAISGEDNELQTT